MYCHILYIQILTLISNPSPQAFNVGFLLVSSIAAGVSTTLQHWIFWGEGGILLDGRGEWRHIRHILARHMVVCFRKKGKTN